MQTQMRAMAITHTADIQKDSLPLVSMSFDIPEPAESEVLVKVEVCAVCHTELDEIEGRTPPNEFPRIPGHQVVGTIERLGSDVDQLALGERVGIAWIYSSCGECTYCQRGDDNLCPEFKATGRDAHGGYAEYVCVPAAFVSRIPESLSSLAAAPLLCAGAIGYRSLRLAAVEDGEALGMTGFGASAHLMMKMLKGLYPRSPVYVFARHEEERKFALELGATWAGSTEDDPPVLLAAIIDTTPAWWPVSRALRCLAPGGRLVINAIRKQDADRQCLAALDYEEQLWMEKEIKSVANVSRRDVREFLDLAARLDIQPEVQTYCLEEANQALLELKFSSVRGAKVLVI